MIKRCFQRSLVLVFVGARDYLAAVATLGGPGGAGVEEVAKALGKEPRQLAVARDRLVPKHGLLEVPERAKVCFVDGESASSDQHDSPIIDLPLLMIWLYSGGTMDGPRGCRGCASILLAHLLA